MSRRYWTVPGTVVRVVDGDTVVMDLDLGWHLTLRRSCRIAEINAPERATEYGPAATEYLRTLLPVGTVVTFISTKLDQYGRPYGQIWTDRDVGNAMIAAGHAEPA